MKVSHEVPLCLLKDSLTFNDYDYLLPHYYKQYPQYKEFYLESRAQGRFIMMDNGLFEGGVWPDSELLEMIYEVEPDIFIVPDAWNNRALTYEHAAKWINTIKLPARTRLMVVLQGEDYYDLELLYQMCHEDGYRYFGFNHSSTAYDKIHPSENQSIGRTMGRIKTLDRLETYGILDKNSYHHLLGVNTPLEVALTNKKYINSIDTSNPIIWGANKIAYNEDCFFHKPDSKIGEFMEEDLDEVTKGYILANIEIFKQLNE